MYLQAMSMSSRMRSVAAAALVALAPGIVRADEFILKPFSMTVVGRQVPQICPTSPQT